MSSPERGSFSSARGAAMMVFSNSPGVTRIASAPASDAPSVAASPKPCHANTYFAPESLR